MGGAFFVSGGMKMKSGDFVIKNNIVFEYNGSDEHVVLPEGVKRFDSDAFEDNTKIKSIYLPSTFEPIEGWMIYGCSSLKSIEVAENNPYMTKSDECIYSKDKTVLLLYPQYLTNKIFKTPSFVKEIAVCAFYHSAVQRVICGSGLERLNESSFDQCYALKEIILPDTLNEIRTDAFTGCNPDLRVSIPGKATLLVKEH